jgi:hypothetical protein
MHLTEEQIHSYLDGLLEEPARRVAEAHLAACADCRRRADELQALFTALGTLPDLPLRRDLTPVLLAKLHPKQSKIESRPALAWSRSLAAQWGLVTGFALWLGMQLAAILELPAVPLPSIPLPVLRLPAQLLDILPAQFPLPQIPLPHLPTFDFQTPSFFFLLSSSHLTLLLTLTALLWVMGNAALLRHRPAASSCEVPEGGACRRIQK